MNWSAYFEKTKNNPPHASAVQAVKEFRALRQIEDIAGQGLKALDFGSGGGRDSRYLVKQGFQVTAIDPDPAAPQHVQDLINSGQVHFLSSISDLPPTQSFALINASYSLPFAGSANFTQTWQKLISHLETGGLFAGQLFGVEDSWNEPSSKLSFFTADQVSQLFQDFKILHLEEQNRQGQTAAGTPKTWHVFHFIIQK